MSWANKYRPRRWTDILGQDIVVRVLKSIISSTAIHSGYLFTGQYGSGKTTLVRIFSKAMNCEKLKDAEPCNRCDPCLSIDAGENIDYIEMDGASSGTVEAIRKLKDSAQYPPLLGKKKIFVIDECHAMSSQAFQALLKILEESPKYLVFILATTEKHKVPHTISSRCMGFNLYKISSELIAGRIKHIYELENVPHEEAAVKIIADQADGSVRDGLILSEQARLFSSEVTVCGVTEMLCLVDSRLYENLVSALISGNVGTTLEAYDVLKSKGVAADIVCNGISEVLSEALRAVNSKDSAYFSTRPYLNSISAMQLLSIFEILTEAKYRILRTWSYNFDALAMALVYIAKKWPVPVSEPASSRTASAADVRGIFSSASPR